MKNSIVGYHQDNESHWMAELECGHFQHVRHNPPWINRPWVRSEQGRQSKIGCKLDCKKCKDELPRDIDS